jgi:hypothetical protein
MVNDKENRPTDFNQKWVMSKGVAWHAIQNGMTHFGYQKMWWDRSNWRGTRCPCVSDLHQCTWHDSFISHVNLTGATQKGKNLKISFERGYFSMFFFLKMGQNKKKLAPARNQRRSVTYAVWPGKEGDREGESDAWALLVFKSIQTNSNSLQTWFGPKGGFPSSKNLK